jgi:diguanylate cyclase (GGDEF)-like protein
MAARYGGEEFTVIMPGTSRREAIKIAERLRNEVERFKFVKGDLQPGGSVTISIGIAELPSDAINSHSLLHKADQALYKAKIDGRNRVGIKAAGMHKRPPARLAYN